MCNFYDGFGMAVNDDAAKGRILRGILGAGFGLGFLRQSKFETKNRDGDGNGN